MARYRTIKPETFADEKLSECCFEARYLFVGLWCFCDDMGRKGYSPKRLKNEIFPADEDLSSQQVAAWTRQLEKAGVLKIYQVDGREYLWLPRFLRHQKIDRPSHSDIPPHPSDSSPDCRCWHCKAARNGGNVNVPSGTHRALDDDSTSPRHVSSVVECSVVESSKNKTNTNTKFKTNEDPFSTARNTSANSSEEHRRTQIEALDRIALRMLRTLDLAPNHLLQQALTRSLTYRAKSKNCTVELAAQQILARAAYLVAESPPNNWLQWFEDVGYEYVPQGDKRLDDKRLEARPVCGGSRCEEGWERVTAGGVPELRRCPDCAKLWEE